MAEQSSSRRGIVFRALTLVAVALIAASFFAPGWWVSLKAPNYPEATFPDGIRIHFHMDSVRNGCQIRASQEVEEDEALDCVHEMDTINHYVGMYPIASGGPVEKAYSPFLFSFLIVMALAFAAPGRKSRMAVSVLGYGAIAVWMGMTMYMPGGIAFQGKGYVYGLVNSLGLDVAETVDDSNLAPIVRQLRDSLAKSQPQEPAAAAGAVATKDGLIAKLKTNFNIDQFKKPAEKRLEWTGSGLQVLAWHYEKSLARWFNIPEKNGPLAAMMDSIATLLGAAILGAMALMIFAAWSVRSPFYWLLVLAPAILPIGFLAEYSAWLWWYGHSLNEMGAFTLKPFMPTVFGQGKVAQFTTYSYPHYGFALMVASSVLLALAGLIRAKQLRLAGDTAENL
ncbi:MAG: hypothetical protein IPL47_07025 [Phyllobacteriaceae bacterium]|nr:hypothetical protein [Phyllobacteriaceae bacterium]